MTLLKVPHNWGVMAWEETKVVLKSQGRGGGLICQELLNLLTHWNSSLQFPYPQEGLTHSVNKHCWIQSLFLVLGRGNSAKCWDTEMEKAQSLPLRGFQTFG